MILSFFSQYLLPAIVLGIIGLIFGILIAVLSKVLAVKEDDRIETVHSMLPGYNCGACGQPGCEAFATAIIEQGEDVDNCKPIKSDQAEAIRQYLRELVESAE